MQLPLSLLRAIETSASRFPHAALKQAAATLSARYQSGLSEGAPFLRNELEKHAYALIRLPGTYAAARLVLGELRRALPDVPLNSLLDLGAGAGGATWAAVETLGELQRCTLLEQDPESIALGQSLVRAAGPPVLQAATWQVANLQHYDDWRSHDLVLCSYVLGELERHLAQRLVQQAWQSASRVLVLIEPGTPRGFATLRTLREELIAAGAHIVAPCPHAQACPMAAEDWCHFAARVERSALQRRLKAGTLGHEDEKFAYVAFAKWPVQPARARILRHPQRHPGLTKLQLCKAEGLQLVTITKRDKEPWRRVRKAAWGDAWD